MLTSVFWSDWSSYSEVTMWRYLRSTEAAQEARRGSHLFLIWFDSGHGLVSLLQSSLKQLLTFILYQSFASACLCPISFGDKHIRGSVREKTDGYLQYRLFVAGQPLGYYSLRPLEFWLVLKRWREGGHLWKMVVEEASCISNYEYVWKRT